MIMSKACNNTSIRCEQFDQPLSQVMIDELQKLERNVLFGLCRLVLIDPMTRFLSETPNGFKLIDHPRRTVFFRPKISERRERKRVVNNYSNVFNSLVFTQSDDGFKNTSSVDMKLKRKKRG